MKRLSYVTSQLTVAAILWRHNSGADHCSFSFPLLTPWVHAYIALQQCSGCIDCTLTEQRMHTLHFYRAVHVYIALQQSSACIHCTSTEQCMHTLHFYRAVHAYIALQRSSASYIVLLQSSASYIVLLQSSAWKHCTLTAHAYIALQQISTFFRAVTSGATSSEHY